MFTIPEIAAATGGRVVGQSHGSVCGISTDSRSVRPGELFVPIVGVRFDGHDFISGAIARGVTTILATEGRFSATALPKTVCCIMVKDTLTALGDLAAAYRSRFDIPVIGVTGSNGKTTAKEMLASVLELTGPGLKTEGNLNNLIGLPAMLFRLLPEHRWAVLEMGMSEPGEIDRLAAIARPNIGIVLNVFPAHLQSMGTVGAVAAAKGELLHRIADSGLAVVNADDPRVAGLPQNPSAGRISFGINRGEVRARAIEPLGLEGQRFLLAAGGNEVAVRLKVCGQHMIYNALATAAALTGMVGLTTIAAGLERFTPYKGRLQVETCSAITLVDDSYNANPASVRAALETMPQMAGQGHRVAVLGDMLELGDYEASAHEGVGALAGRNVDRLFLLGPLMNRYAAEGARSAGMPPERIQGCGGQDELIARLTATLQPGDVVLVKGSRGMGMERILNALREGLLPGKEE
jgi:UDP-N-acetylmuramoyl-tripeptide--D-alanyl-D-alanine ligase